MLVDMARNLIRLAGFVPDEDIPIAFTGIRPGEKLYEELIGPDEAVEPADAPDVMCVQPLRLPSADLLTQQVAELERRARAEDAAGVLEQLRVIIPEFRATPRVAGRGRQRRAWGTGASAITNDTTALWRSHPVSLYPASTRGAVGFVVALGVFLFGLTAHLSAGGTAGEGRAQGLRNTTTILAESITALGGVVALIGIIQKATVTPPKLCGGARSLAKAPRTLRGSRDPRSAVTALMRLRENGPRRGFRPLRRRNREDSERPRGHPRARPARPGGRLISGGLRTQDVAGGLGEHRLRRTA
jgi:hypothetical protein